MMKKSLIAAGLYAAGLSSAFAAPYGFFDARSVAMGNVSVATGNTTTAAFSNPAMLSINENKDTFAFLIPAIGVQAVDNGGLVDLVDEFQVLVDQPLSSTTVTQMNNLLGEMNGKSLTVNAAAGTALVYAGDSFTMAGSYRASGQAGVIVTNINTGSDVPPYSEPTGDVDGRGYAAQELAISIATKVSVAGMDLAIGVRPKTVQVDTIVYSETLRTVDTDNVISDALEEDLGSFSTIDAGIAVQLLDSFTVGLVTTNIVSETLTTSTGQEFKFDTHMRAGVSYHNDFLTVAADMDLTEIDPITVAGVPMEDPAKMLSVGVELNAWDFMQLRAGYQSNMASGADAPDLFSAGVGFWLGFHLDVAVTAAEDSSLGAFVQTGFRF